MSKDVHLHAVVVELSNAAEIQKNLPEIQRICATFGGKSGFKVYCDGNFSWVLVGQSFELTDETLSWSTFQILTRLETLFSIKEIKREVSSRHTYFKPIDS